MRPGTRILLSAALAAAAPCAGVVTDAGSAAAREVGISCADFRQNADGSWTPVRRTVIVGPRGPFSVEPGQVQGTTNYGVKIAEILNDRCR
jgi:hypothetical protein